MQKRHQDRSQYFDEQAYTTRKYVIPFLKEVMTVDNTLQVLEIGCGEGGNMKPFLDMGCQVTGVDLVARRIENAEEFYSGHKNRNNLRLICQDIYEVKTLPKFDLIIMRDVIEHIHNQEGFMGYVKRFLKPSGKFFLGFPPWQNPFGGHQQICKSKILSKTPFFHILPKPVYKGILSSFGEKEHIINDLMEIKETRITIERFKDILKEENYHIDREVFYLINPNYEVKFGLQPRIQNSLVSAVPYLRNYATTVAYYIISLKNY